jgi:hypothetical protein
MIAFVKRNWLWLLIGALALYFVLPMLCPKKTS